MQVDPILVFLVASWAAAWAAGRWWTTRRVAASICGRCGNRLGRAAARQRRKLQLVGRDIWEVACPQCWAGQLVWLGTLGR